MRAENVGQITNVHDLGGVHGFRTPTESSFYKNLRKKLLNYHNEKVIMVTNDQQREVKSYIHKLKCVSNMTSNRVEVHLANKTQLKDELFLFCVEKLDSKIIAGNTVLYENRARIVDHTMSHGTSIMLRGDTNFMEASKVQKIRKMS